MKKLLIKLCKEIKISDFQNTNLIFRKQTKNFIFIIEFQPSKNSEVNNETFTINIGVFSPKIHFLTWGNDIQNIKEVDCVFRTRISYFLNTKKDFWWNLTNDIQQFNNTKEQVKILIENEVIHFFDKISSNEDLLNLMVNWNGSESKYPLYKIQLSVLNFLCDNHTKALDLLQELSMDSVWGENASNVTNRLLDTRNLQAV